jgi:outer membrane biosynthesis protein TonB
VSGRLEIQVKDVGAFQLGPGDRDFMPAETWHIAEVLGDEPVLYFVGIKQPLPPAKVKPKTPKRKPTTKRKPAIIKAEIAKGTTKSVTKKPIEKPTTRRKPVVKKAKPAKATTKKSKAKTRS